MINLINNEEITFAEYLASHPHLYDGIQLSGAEIDKINKHFWTYNVFEKTFSHNFLTTLDEVLERYHKMKEKEFIEQIGELTTNKEILKIAGHVANNSANTSQGWNNTTNNAAARHSENNNKQGSRDMSMKTTGSSSIENLVNWSDGASVIGENKSTSDSRAYTDTINSTDGRSLTNIATQWNTNDSERTIIGQQAVKSLENIISYLRQPKALQWLLKELSVCFVLIY